MGGTGPGLWLKIGYGGPSVFYAGGYYLTGGIGGIPPTIGGGRPPGLGGGAPMAGGKPPGGG